MQERFPAGAMNSSVRGRVKDYGQIDSMENVSTLPGMQGTRRCARDGSLQIYTETGDDSYRRLLWKVEKYALWRALMMIKQKKRKQDQ